MSKFLKSLSMLTLVISLILTNGAVFAAEPAKLVNTWVRFTDPSAEEAKLLEQKQFLDKINIASTTKLAALKTPLTSIEAGKRVKATTAVFNEGGAEAKTIMVLAQYKNNTLVSTGMCEKTIAPNEQVSMSSEVTVGNITDGVMLKVFVWEKDDVMPIAPIAVFPSSNANLSAIRLDGKPLEGFSPEVMEYTVDIANTPIVTGITCDNSAEAITNYDYAGNSINVAVTASDCITSKTYKLNVINTTPIPNVNVSDLVFHGKKSATFIATADDVKYNPSWVVGETYPSIGGVPEPPKLASDGMNKENIKEKNRFIFSDRGFTVATIDSYIEGYPSILPTLNWKNSANYFGYKSVWTSKTPSDLFSFNIDKSSKICILTSGYIPSWATTQNGWSKQIGNFFTSSHSEMKSTVMFEKIIELSAGETFKTVTMQTPGIGDVLPYQTVVKPVLSSGITPSVSKLQFAGTDAQGAPLSYPDDETNIRYGLKDGSYIYKDRDTEEGMQIIDIADEFKFENCYYIQQMFAKTWQDPTLKAAYAIPGKPWHTFNISVSADIIVLGETNGPTNGGGYSNYFSYEQDNSWINQKVPETGFFARKSMINSTTVDGKSYKCWTISNYDQCWIKSINVAPGESAKVTIPTKGSEGRPPLVIIRFK